MPLEGAHADVACASATPRPLFKLAALDTGELRQCHKSPHDGHLFATKECELCHSPALQRAQAGSVRPQEKTEVRADRQARGHRSATSCHTKALGETKPKESCETCHAKDNQHGDALRRVRRQPAGVRDVPHAARVEGRVRVQPRERTPVGAHREARRRPRAATATAARRRRTSSGSTSRTAAWAVTATSNAHGGKYRNDQCLTCHEEGGSKRADARTRSRPTTARRRGSRCATAHAGVKCELCHPNDVFQSTPSECGVDMPRGLAAQGLARRRVLALPQPRPVGPRCASITREDTKWPLTGKHARSRTARAATRSASSPTRRRRAAGGCHAKDDAHKGRLGTTCERCHRDDGDNIFNHNTMRSSSSTARTRRLRCARLPSVDHVQAGAARLLRLPPRARGPQGPVRHRLRAVPHDDDVRATSSRCTTSATSRCAARTTTSRASAATRTTGRSPAPATCASTATARTTSTATRCRRAAASATRSGRSRRRASITRASAAT